MSDKEVLKQSILVEYNAKTGNVLSTFFSDDKDVKGISYGEIEGYFNGNNRGAKELKAGATGYWDVNSTGEAESEPEDVNDTLKPMFR